MEMIAPNKPAAPLQLAALMGRGGTMRKLSVMSFVQPAAQTKPKKRRKQSAQKASFSVLQTQPQKVGWCLLIEMFFAKLSDANYVAAGGKRSALLFVPASADDELFAK